MASPLRVRRNAAASSSSPRAGDEVRTELDSYTLREQIGEGTFSVVFKAEAAQQGVGHAVVAAKILKDGQSDYTRIIKEFRCLSELKGHENVVEVLDGKSDGTRIILVMPCASPPLSLAAAASFTASRTRARRPFLHARVTRACFVAQVL